MASKKIERALSAFEVEREAQRARYIDELLRRPGRLDTKIEGFLFDLDGCLANVDHRDPMDARSCDEDPPNAPVVAVARALQLAGYGIVCSSGRSEAHRSKTHNFLMWGCHLTEYLKLVMRPLGDTRPDAIVKRELYLREIAPFYDIIAVFDDRPSVCDAWVELGLTVLQVRTQALDANHRNPRYQPGYFRSVREASKKGVEQ